MSFSQEIGNFEQDERPRQQFQSRSSSRASRRGNILVLVLFAAAAAATGDGQVILFRSSNLELDALEEDAVQVHGHRGVFGRFDFNESVRPVRANIDGEDATRGIGTGSCQPRQVSFQEIGELAVVQRRGQVSDVETTRLFQDGRIGACREQRGS